MNTRTLITSTAFALLFGANAHAQTQPTPVEIAPAAVSPAKGTGMAEAPGDELAQEKRNISRELKNTLGMSDNLLSKTMAMLAESKDEENTRLSGVANSLKTVQANLTTQLGLVGKATATDSKEVFAKAKETNGSSQKMLEELKGQLTAPAK